FAQTVADGLRSDSVFLGHVIEREDRAGAPVFEVPVVGADLDQAYRVVEVRVGIRGPAGEPLTEPLGVSLVLQVSYRRDPRMSRVAVGHDIKKLAKRDHDAVGHDIVGVDTNRLPGYYFCC